MIDVIFAIKFVHALAAAAMFGVWLAIALLMAFAHRSDNTSVVALTSRFVVRIELFVMVAVVALLPISGYPLATAIGLSPLEESWIEVSFAVYGAVVVSWLMALFAEIRVRNITRDAALSGAVLPPAYRRLFRVWAALGCVVLGGMIALFALMIWQPRFEWLL